MTTVDPSGTEPTSTREAIAQAAGALFAAQGFAATSVEDIAAAAGVAKGSIFYNFGSKAALFEWLIDRGVGRLADGLEAARTGKAGREAVEALVVRLLEHIRDHTDYVKMMAAEVFRTGRAWQDSIQQIRERCQGVFAEVIAADWPERQAAVAGAAVFGATLVAGLEWVAFHPELSADEVARSVLAVTIDPL